MSDVMLFGVLRMPYEMAMSGEISRRQFYSRAQEAADRIERLERELAERRPRLALDPELKAALEEAAKTRSTVALLPDGEPVFINYGDQPEDMEHLCCTACGGSGHIDDQRQIASLAERKPASIDTLEFQALAGTWCGASQSCDQWTRTIGARQAWKDLIAYIDGRTDGTASEAKAVAWAVTAERGGIHKLSITKESAERKAAVWREEWPNNGCQVRPLVFGDAAAPSSMSKGKEEAND